MAEAVKPDVLRAKRNFLVEGQRKNSSDVIVVNVCDNQELELQLGLRELGEARAKRVPVDAGRSAVDQDSADISTMLILNQEAVAVARGKHF